MIGPGKYDELALYALKQAKAKGVILLVIDGTKGSSLSCKLPPDLSVQVPAILTMIADLIAEENKNKNN